jgi:membrane protease YdiL (CAAX protease family)
MLSGRPWKVDAVIRLMIGLMLGWLAALLITGAIGKTPAGKPLFADRLVQFTINTFSFHLIVLVLVHFFLRHHQVSWRQLFGLNQFRFRMAVLALGVIVIVLPVALWLNSFSAALLTRLHMQPVEQAAMQALELSITLGQKIVFGISVIVVAPIVEESMFRGIFYPSMKQEGYPRAALFGSSLLFAMIHGNLMSFVPLFGLGLVFVFLFEVTDTLLTSIIAHSSFNAANFIIYLNRETLNGWWEEAWHHIRGVLPF